MKMLRLIRSVKRDLCLIIKRHKSRLQSLITEHTEISQNHMTPEIQLHLVTPNCSLWYSRGDCSPFVDPFWAFYWPGGQVLSRYILDNSKLFKGKHIIDIGSGCGATSIACKLAGAHHVVANDIDLVACEAILLNSRLNGVEVTLSDVNMVGQTSLSSDIILLGDMFYDESSAGAISDWLQKFVRPSTVILIGDPGRYSFENHPMKKTLTKLQTFDLPLSCQSENNGLTKGHVWELKVL